jgi:hypothetical protein
MGHPEHASGISNPLQQPQHVTRLLAGSALVTLGRPRAADAPDRAEALVADRPES